MCHIMPPYSWGTHVGRPGMTSRASAMSEDWWRLVKTGSTRGDLTLAAQVASIGVYFAVFWSLWFTGAAMLYSTYFHIFPLIYDHCIMTIHTARLTYRIWTYHLHRTSEILGALTDGRLSQGSQGSRGWEKRQCKRWENCRGKEFMMLWMWFNFHWREYGTELCAWRELCTKLYYTDYTDYTYSYLSLPCLWDYHSMKWNLTNLNLVYDLYEHLPIIVNSEKKSASLLQHIWIQCIFVVIPWNVLLFFGTLNRSRWSLVGASVKQRSWDINDLGCCFTAIFTSRRFLRPVPVPLRACRHHSALISLLSRVHIMTWQTLFGSVCPMPQPNVGKTHSWNILIYVWFFSWLKHVTMALFLCFSQCFTHEKHRCFTCAKCVGGTSASMTSVMNRLWGSIRGDPMEI